MRHFLIRAARDKSGATAIEYGLIAGFVVVLLIVGLTGIGGKLASTFDQVSAALP
jgi:pilus assembly protein Flp/PilA